MMFLYLNFFALLLFSISQGFLTETNSSVPLTGTTITDNHYITIIDFLAEEKEARRQLEQFAQQLQNELYTVKQDVENLKHSNNSCLKVDLHSVKNDTVSLKEHLSDLKNSSEIVEFELFELKQNYTQLKNVYDKLQTEQSEMNNNYSLLQTETKRLQSDVILNSNKTLRLEHDFQSFLIVHDGEELQNLTTLQNEIKTINQQMQGSKSQIDSLVRTNKIRTQDFLALINEDSKIQTKLMQLERDNYMIKNETSSLSNTIASKCMAALDPRVSVYACGPRSLTYRRGQVVTFQNTKVSVGFNSASQFHSTGIFTADKGGLYIVSTTIMSSTSNSFYYIFKNSEQLSYVYIGDRCSDHASFTGSMVVAVQLNVGDRILVKAGVSMEVNGPASCLSVIKIK